MNRRNIVFVLCFVLGLVADQVSKWWVIENIELDRGEVKIIDGLLSFVYTQNPGALLGFGADFAYRHVIFLAFTVLAMFVIADMFRKLPPTDVFMSSALGLVLSGAVGNGLDRLRFGKVTDFISVYSDSPSVVAFFRQFGLAAKYPTFNIADAALVIGIGMFIVHYVVIDRRRAREA